MTQQTELRTGESAGAASTTGAAAWTWLQERFEQVMRSPQPPAQPICEILVGLYICDYLIHRRHLSEPYRSIAAQAASALDEADARSYNDVAPTLKLLTATILTRSGYGVAYLDQYLEICIEILAEPAACEDTTERLGLLEKAFLLHGAGLFPEPHPGTRDEFVSFANTLRLPAPPPAIERLALHAEALSGWGTRQPGSQSEDDWIEDMMRGFGVAALRQYDVLAGCKLLRAMAHLGYDASAGVLGDFVLRQQRPDGSFGFLGPEQAELRVLAPMMPSDTALYLPVTIQCLWSVTEWMFPDWRLFNSSSHQA